MVREMKNTDGWRILEIYQMGIETGHATFEVKVPSWKNWDSMHLKKLRFVFEENNKILGWVALSPVSNREVYKGVTELSLYVDPNFHKRGIGSALMEKIINASEKNGIWTLCSAVFPENMGTLRLHQKFGFRIIGTREKIGLHNGIWRDTILLERRSLKTGI